MFFLKQGGKFGFLNELTMCTKEKLTYETPSLRLIEMKQEDVICASPDETTENVHFQNPFDDEGEDW